MMEITESTKKKARITWGDVAVVAVKALLIGTAALFMLTTMYWSGFFNFLTKDKHYISITVSNSMEPAILTNAFVLVEYGDFSDVEAGDIILYAKDNEMICHRVIEIGENTDGKLMAMTKGDNNDRPDNRVTTEETYRGRVKYIGNWFAKGTRLFGGRSISSDELDPNAFGRVKAAVIAGLLLIIAGCLIGVYVQTKGSGNSKKRDI